MSIDISKSAIPLFQSRERLELLNDIDKFRQHGLANLPQIVVCGDTSSGKSSVLGALSGIPFPIDSTVCTRFATEIALRYSPDKTITGEAFISPGSGSSEGHRARVKSFQRAITSLEAIPDIMQDAKTVMGIGEAAGISRDVLHLRLHGQPLPNLTLVDLPGLIHASKNTDDIAKVQELVEHYFKQEESLILTIVSAENPIDNQGILTSSQRFDPAGARSIGVITKPDLLHRPDKARLMPTILELARNQHSAFKFKRPWQIIRCLTDDERQKGADGAAIETELFCRDPWNGFSRDRLGTRSLRSVLCQYLEDHIVRVLPQLIESLDTRIAAVKSSLGELGPHRATRDERMQYLIRISRRYGQLVKDALNGDYSDSFFHKSEPAKRLRATTMALTDDFEHAMRTRGHMFEISFSPPLSEASDGPRRISRTDALVKVGKLLEGYRGPELPFLFNPRLVGELFKEQSQKWSIMASEYTGHICRAVRTFLRKVVESICPSTGRTAELILRHVFDDAVYDSQEKLNKKVLELFAPYTSSFLFSTRGRLQASMKTVENQDEPFAKADATTRSRPRSSNLESPGSDNDTRLKLLQCSRAYYNVALETFIDNVVVLGVESCLLSKLEEMFSPETVARMGEDKLQLLGGESAEMISERRDLQAQLETLEAALKNCRRHASREFGFGSDEKESGTRSLLSAQSVFTPRGLNDGKANQITGAAEPAARSETRQQKPLPTLAVSNEKDSPQVQTLSRTMLPSSERTRASPVPISTETQKNVSETPKRRFAFLSSDRPWIGSGSWVKRTFWANNIFWDISGSWVLILDSAVFWIPTWGSTVFWIRNWVITVFWIPIWATTVFWISIWNIAVSWI
ncbi:uncharacterized protein Z518_02174 [Rhinocladiella mackenziei CBS 650.93]|uniref:GED domain-containing protein n=1 Tax=Rhinocladiella mackenziei CBS 650.93 TaxID=1442369 RepID=A0A0D2IW92_9EURO|nr:uncharacterized protein Z518_02174 [Rhinocladiella mackenziei CBS 650.93]KIX07521.1 hypothetical protein Z518_02174 [Rhinocladiella mackenziei CBS 650.93]